MAKRSKARAKPKASAGKPRAGGALAGVVSKASGALRGGSKGGGSRRGKGPVYWANRVLVAKLQKRYRNIKYGSVR